MATQVSSMRASVTLVVGIWPSATMSRTACVMPSGLLLCTGWMIG